MTFSDIKHTTIQFSLKKRRKHYDITLSPLTYPHLHFTLNTHLIKQSRRHRAIDISTVYVSTIHRFLILRQLKQNIKPSQEYYPHFYP